MSKDLQRHPPTEGLLDGLEDHPSRTLLRTVQSFVPLEHLLLLELQGKRHHPRGQSRELLADHSLWIVAIHGDPSIRRLPNAHGGFDV